MKRKILILIPLLFLLCGCTAEVNLDIDNMAVNENVNIYAYSDDNYSKSQLLTAFRKYVPAYDETPIVDTMPDEKVDGTQYYNRTEQELSDGYRFTYDYKFNINSYKKARTLKGAYKASTIQVNKKDQEILISTDKSSLLYFSEYPTLNGITVNIRTTYPVKESNADSINGNIYSWNFDKNTKKNIYLLLSTEKTSNNNNPNKKEENNSSKNEEESAIIEFMNKHPFIVAIAAIFLFIIAVAIISKITKNKY